MKRFARLAAATGLCATLLSTGAMAASPMLSFAGGSDSSLIGVVFNPTWASGFSSVGFDLTHMQKGGVLSIDQSAKVTYTFVGKEAGYTNLFRSFVTSYGVDGQQIVGSNANLGSSINFNNVGAGVLSYGFLSNGAGSLFLNGSTSTGVTLSSDKKSALVFFNDLGGDRDYDDMVIKVSIAAVPEPETYAMLLAGLGIMGGIARRRRTKA